MWCVWQKITRLLTTPMLPWVQCLRHGRPCQLRTADLDVSGFPCVDWSPAGKQLGIYGKTFEVLLALVAWHRSCRTPIVLLENVPEFNVQVLRFLVGDLYDVQARSQIAFWRRSIRSENRKIFSKTYQSCTCSLESVQLRATALYWFNATQARGIAVKPPHKTQMYNSFGYLLRPTEEERLRKYEALWLDKYGQTAAEDANVIFHLGDNPDNRACMTRPTGQLPTFRKSMGLCWHPSSKTVLLPMERLSLLGWPVFPDLAQAGGVGPVDSWFAHMPGNKISQAAGNAYHIPSFGVWALTALACLRSASLPALSTLIHSCAQPVARRAGASQSTFTCGSCAMLSKMAEQQKAPVRRPPGHHSASPAPGSLLGRAPPPGPATVASASRQLVPAGVPEGFAMESLQDPSATAPRGRAKVTGSVLSAKLRGLAGTPGPRSIEKTDKGGRRVSSENFSSKYTKIEDIPVDDMHALLFGCSETWGNKRRLGHLSREQLLTVIEYVTGQRRTDALIDRNRLKWREHLIGDHKCRKNELGDECFDRSAEDILKIMAERNRQSSSGQPVAGGQRAPPQIVQSVDGKRRAVFYDDRTKWLPEGPAYQLQLDK
eukprot:s1757_g12.t2